MVLRLDLWRGMSEEGYLTGGLDFISHAFGAKFGLQSTNRCHNLQELIQGRQRKVRSETRVAKGPSRDRHKPPKKGGDRHPSPRISPTRIPYPA
jgi:hypothetical protein